MHATHRILIPISSEDLKNMPMKSLVKTVGQEALEKAVEYSGGRVFDYGTVTDVIFGKIYKAEFEKELNGAYINIVGLYDTSLYILKELCGENVIDVLASAHDSEDSDRDKAWNISEALEHICDILRGTYTWDTGFLDVSDYDGILDENKRKEIAEKKDEFAIVKLNVHC